MSDNHIREQRVDWQKTMRFVFNEKSNPDDNNLGHQIVKVRLGIILFIC